MELIGEAGEGGPRLGVLGPTLDDDVGNVGRGIGREFGPLVVEDDVSVTRA